jgi:hypothetical protein
MSLKSHMVYSLTHEIGICVIDLEQDVGNISWGN